MNYLPTEEVERLKLLSENKVLRNALAFAACAIKCGDNWTETCEKEIGSALAIGKERLDPILAKLETLNKRIDQCWTMASMFLENKDAHGLHDAGVEIQALQRARAELMELR